MVPVSALATDADVFVWVKNAPGYYAAASIYVVTLTVMVYDILLTLADEREYVWSSKWSHIKIVFLIIRYFPFSIYLVGAITAVSPSTSTCLALAWYGRMGCIFVMAVADIFLTHRVYAFCGENKYLLSFLIITFFGWEATVFSFVAFILPHRIVILDPLFHHSFAFDPGCIPEDSQKTAIIWVGMLCYQSILFLCFISSALYKHRIFNCGIWSLGSQQAPLYGVFIRDGFWAYFVIVASLILNVVITFRSNFLGDSFVLLSTEITSICSCRLILNIRSAAYKPMSDNSIYV